jgi:hypothetical protein
VVRIVLLGLAGTCIMYLIGLLMGYGIIKANNTEFDQIY